MLYIIFIEFYYILYIYTHTHTYMYVLIGRRQNIIEINFNTCMYWISSVEHIILIFNIPGLYNCNHCGLIKINFLHMFLFVGRILNYNLILQSYILFYLSFIISIQPPHHNLYIFVKVGILHV